MTLLTAAFGREPLADLIDASSWTPAVTNIAGDGDVGGYTYAVWVAGAGNGATITPNGGDIAKKLFFPNTGRRDYASGAVQYYGLAGTYKSANEYQSYTSSAWTLHFAGASVSTSGVIGYNYKLDAMSIRCVRS